jgi:hypothetical protein
MLPRHPLYHLPCAALDANLEPQRQLLLEENPCASPSASMTNDFQVVEVLLFYYIFMIANPRKFLTDGTIAI